MYHRQSIETWLHEELFAIKVHDHHNTEITQHLLTSATLVDFPQFPNIYHLIPQVLDLRPKHTTQRDYHQIEDSDKWEIYVEYRKIVSRFLINRRHRSSPSIYQPSLLNDPPRYYSPVEFFVGQEHYVYLAKYLLSFLSNGFW